MKPLEVVARLYSCKVASDVIRIHVAGCTGVHDTGPCRAYQEFVLLADVKARDLDTATALREAATLMHHSFGVSNRGAFCEMARRLRTRARELEAS